MQLRFAYLTVLLINLSIHVIAFPVNIGQPARRKAPPYRVVQVDGGSTNADPPVPATTIIETRKSIETVTNAETKYIVSTVVQTQQNTPITVRVTTTQIPAQVTVTPTPTPVPQIFNPPAAAVPPPNNEEVSANMPVPGTPSPASNVGSVAVSSATSPAVDPDSTKGNGDPSAVTVAASSSSTAYYDDGMWHTYYPIKSSTSSTVLPSLPTQAAAIYEGGQPSNTTYRVSVRERQVGTAS